MQFKILLLVMIFSLAPGWNAIAQEKPWTGGISLIPARVHIKGSRAKFNEYRDLRDGASGHFSIQYDAENTYFNFKADDVGYRDQTYELNGGKKGSYSYHLDYEETPHNLTLGTTLHR